MWHKDMVWKNREIVGLDSGIIMHPNVWHASGHTSGFADVCVVSRKSGKRYRLDHLFAQVGVDIEHIQNEKELKTFFDKNKHMLTIEGEKVENLSDPFFQNLLVESNLGSIDEETTYLRGETCQGVYINYKQVIDSMKNKLPFGIAQIGKAFRNEISPRQFLFRTREFEQMEMQYFVDTQDAEKEFQRWLDNRYEWYKKIGLTDIQKTPHKHLVFYAQAAVDIEYNFSFGWGELEGIHNRGEYDLTQHATHSKQRLAFFDEEKKAWKTPSIIETSVGVGRLALALLTQSYTIDEIEGSERLVLKLHPNLAPIRVAILPHEKKHNEYAQSLFSQFSHLGYVQYDGTRSIGKRYRRQDEVGTPYCITVDDETIKNKSVTLRDRDTTQQQRLTVEECLSYIQKASNI